MLLSADPDGFDLSAALVHDFEAFRDRGFGGIDPGLGILFDVTRRQTFDRAVGALRQRDHLARFEIKHDGFGASGAAIDSERKHE